MQVLIPIQEMLQAIYAKVSWKFALSQSMQVLIPIQEMLQAIYTKVSWKILLWSFQLIHKQILKNNIYQLFSMTVQDETSILENRINLWILLEGSVKKSLEFTKD